MVGGHPWERRRPRRQGFPNFMRVRPPMPEPLPTGATGYSSQRSVLGRRGRRRSQVGIRGTLPASQVSLQHFPRLTGRRWRVPVRSVRLTDRAGHRRFASAGKDARGPRVHSFQSPCGVSKPSRSPQCPRIFEQLFFGPPPRNRPVSTDPAPGFWKLGKHSGNRPILRSLQNPGRFSRLPSAHAPRVTPTSPRPDARRDIIHEPRTPILGAFVFGVSGNGFWQPDTAFPQFGHGRTRIPPFADDQ